MFFSSSPKPIDITLTKVVDKIEEQSPGLSVLAAREFRYSLTQILVKLTISEPRKFNVLEEFILRAGLELIPSPTETELATVLGLDPIFIKTTTANLQKLQTLKVTPDSKITLTEQGKQFYKKGSVPQEPQNQEVFLVSDLLLGTVNLKSESGNKQCGEHLPNLLDIINITQSIPNVSNFSLEELQQLAEDSGLGLHRPNEGKIVTAYNLVSASTTIWQIISVFVLFDTIEDRLTISVRQGKTILEEASNWLDQLYLEGKISLQDLYNLSDETIAEERDNIIELKNKDIEERIAKISKKSLEIAKETRANINSNLQLKNAENTPVILLRDSQIRQSFLATIKSAKKQVFIYSPWVSKEVVDQQFIEMLQKLAQQGVWILIGHGIAKKPEDEDRPIPAQVEQKLREIKTPEGLSAVQIFWLGNSHAKEVVVDRKVHLCGSHNWLSYRGDRLPRGETVYQVTIPEQVQEAYKFLASRFESHAEKLWNQSIQNRDVILAESSLCIWGGLDRLKMALQHLQANKFWEVYPLWLKVVCQGLRSKNISPDADYLLTALSLLSEISVEDINIELLRDGWGKVIGAITSQNPDVAVKLLSDGIWQEFIRLGIAETPINSPSQFIDKLHSR